MNANEHTTLQHWITELRERGHIASKQRIAIMEALYEQREIADMEDFWIELRQKHPVSWATFYNFIRLAMKEHWIEKSTEAPSSHRYQIILD